MLRNYLKIAWRNFWRNKIFSLINVIGLAIGISAALVIYLIVHYEFSFDKFEKDPGRIYRVTTNMSFAGMAISFSGVPAPLPQAAAKEATGLELTAGFQQFNGAANVSVARSDREPPHQYKHQPDIIFADENYFKLIPYQWLAGSPSSALRDPYQVVLTEQRAKTYFPAADYADLIGKRIIYDDSITTTVAGVVRPTDQNTDFIFKEFISLPTIGVSSLKKNYAWDEWRSVSSNSQMFIKLSPGAKVSGIARQFKSLLEKYNKEVNRDDKNKMDFSLQPLGDLHFNSGMGTYDGHVANKPTLYGLLTVAAFLLLLGCLNFINLTTAQSLQRAKEIGIRKTMGSSKAELMGQFLNETLLITVVATLLSMVLTPLLLKIFADFIPKDLHFDLLHQPSLIVFLILLVPAVSVLSGFYPALVLSRYNPVVVLKNQAYAGTSSSRNALLRKGLTVTQFLIAQFFVMATAITVKQIHYLLNKDMGFKKDAIVFFSIPLGPNNTIQSGNKRLVLLDAFKSIPGIERVSLGQAPPSTSGWSIVVMNYKDGKKEIQTSVNFEVGDSNYLPLYHIKLLAGRNVMTSDTAREYLINETYMHVLGFQHPEDALNKLINGKPVVGVMADFNQQSLHAPIKPLAFYSDVQYSYTFHVALKPQDAEGNLWKATLGQMEREYKKIFPGEEFNYTFFDESIARFYKSEQNISSLLKWATGLAIFISCMGLLGLVIYSHQQRTKEIGVRKVLGASVSQLVFLLSMDFLFLVLLAFVIAAPVAWWTMHKWLEHFAYRTSMNWWVFALSGIGMLLIAVVTLSIQTVRTALANPVDSLRTE